jgi:hypothetical protein
MHELIPPALMMLLGGMLNAMLPGPIARLDTTIFRALGFPESFVTVFCNEMGVRSVGWIAIMVSFVLLAVGLLAPAGHTY